MKKIIPFILAAGLIFAAPVYAQQGKGKGNDKGGKNQTEKPKDDKEKPGANGKDKDNQGKGHAYGKDKDTLSGREFGQQRAAEARSKKEAVEQAEAGISGVEATNNDSKDKIKQARERLEAKKKNGQVSKADYEKKKKALDDLEKEIKELDKANTELKEKLDKEKKK
jgi:colicin import membrane protein